MAERGPLPKYLQISERLIREIAAGHLAEGTRLAPEREMAAAEGVSVGTLRKSLDDLESKGLLRRVQGSGNYVDNPGNAAGSVYGFLRLEKVAGGGLPTAEVLSVRRARKPRDAADFGPGEEAHRIRRLRFLDRQPVALEEIWLDGRFAPQLAAEALSESLYRFYRDRLGLVIVRVEDRVGVGVVPSWREPRFRPAVGARCGFIERVSWGQDGARAEFSRTWFDSDRARYISRIR